MTSRQSFYQNSSMKTKIKKSAAVSGFGKSDMWRINDENNVNRRLSFLPVNSNKRQSMMPSYTNNRQSMSVKPTTNQNRNSMSTSRLSTSRQSIQPKDSKRKSTYGGSKSIIEPRPVKDKGYQTDVIHLLIEYLTENNYDRKISQQILMSPSGKDFFSICEFLFRRIDPSFSYEKKPEEEVPQMFKSLKYPFQLSSRSLVSPGSPHTWPLLLAALHWLIELLIFDERAQMRENDEIPNEEESCEVENRVDRANLLFFEFAAESYRARIMESEDQEIAIDNEFISHMSEVNESLKQSIENKIEETQKLRNCIEELENSPDRLHVLQEEVQILEKDSEKFCMLISRLDQHKAQIEEKQKEYKLALKKEEEEIKQIQQEIFDLENKLSKQIDQNIDVDKLNRERKELESNIKVTKAHRDDIEKATDQLEKEYTTKFNELEKSVSIFNQLCRNAFITTELCGEMKFNPHEENILSMDLKTFVKPKLYSILDRERLARSQNKETLFKLNDQVDRLKDTVNKNELLNSKLFSKLETLQNTHNRLRDAREEQQQRFEEQMKILTMDIQAIGDENQILVQKESEILQLAQRVEDNKYKYKLEQERLYTTLMDLVDWIAGHKEYIRGKLKELTDYLETQTVE